MSRSSAISTLSAALPAFVLVVALGSGAELALDHWRPTGILPKGAYDWAFFAHGAALLALLPALLLVLAYLGGRGRDRNRGRPAPRDTRVVALAIASVGQLLGLGVPLPFGASFPLPGLEHWLVLGPPFPSFVLELTALAAIAVLVSEAPHVRRIRVLLAISAVATCVPAHSSLVVLAAPARLVCTTWLLVLALRGHGRNARLPALFGALATFTFWEGVLLSQLLRAGSSDGHLRDTYFVTAVLHLLILTCVLAVLAEALRLRSEHGSQSLVRSGLVLCALGSQLMPFAMLVLGSRGMPLQYWHYLPEFQTLHRMVAVGGTLLTVGVGLVLVELWLRKARARQKHE